MSDLSVFDTSALCTVVVRDGDVVYANDATLALVEQPREAVLGVPFTAFVAPEDAARLRERYERRRRGEPVPTHYETTIVTRAGARRPVEVFASVDGERTIVQLRDRSAEAEHRMQVVGLSELGLAVLCERSAEAIYQSANVGLAALDLVSALGEPRGEAVHIRATRAPGSATPAAPGALAAQILGVTRPWSSGMRQAWREGAAYLDDAPVGLGQFLGGPEGERARQGALDRSLLRAAAVRIDVGGTPRELLLVLGRWLAPEDLPVLRLFASHISAALDAAGAIDHLSRRNEALAAINRVAALASAAPDLAELFRGGGAEVARVAGCDALAIYLVDEAAHVARLVHQEGGSDEGARVFASVPFEGTTNLVAGPSGDPGPPASLLWRVVQGADAQVWQRDEFPEPARSVIARMGQQVIAAIPLIARSKVIGVLNVTYGTFHAVDAETMDLLKAMGAHFAAAVEAQRLYADLRASYEELAKAQAQLVARERLAALGELAAVVAHEVRNPLGAIFNALGPLEREVPRGGVAATLLEIVGQEAARLNLIVSDLLDFARPRAPILRQTALPEVLRHAARAVLGHAHGSVRVVEVFDPALPRVPVDEHLLHQAFVNIILNALQAMPEGGTLTLSAEHETRSGGDIVRVDIRDTGVGLDAEACARLFEPFFTTKAAGTGLGLALVKRIVEDHRGHVSASSTSGQGTTFTVRLPMGPADSGSPAPSQAPRSS